MTIQEETTFVTSEPRAEALRGARDIAPLALGVSVYGLAFGLLAAQAGMNSLEVGLMSSLVFAGSSQIIAVERLMAGAGAVAAIVAGLALNLRLVLVTASIRDVYANRPLWQTVLGAHLTTDENWALMLARRAREGEGGYWYLLGAGLVLMAVWCGSTVLGVVFAAAIPEPRALGMDFAFTAAFIAISRALWRGKADLGPWLTAAALVIGGVASGFVDSSWAIILGGLGGAFYAGLARANGNQ